MGERWSGSRSRTGESGGDFSAYFSEKDHTKQRLDVVIPGAVFWLFFVIFARIQAQTGGHAIA